MGVLEEELSQLIEFHYGSKAAFARKVGLAQQTLYSMLKSNVTGASLATVMPVAAELRLDPFQLAQGKLVTKAVEQGSVSVPLYGSIAAGKPIDKITVDDSFPIPAELHEAYPHAFLLRVKGTSMNRVLPDGCYALIEPCSDIDMPGQPYAMSVGADEATIKRVKPLANGLMLEPDSSDPTYRPMVFDFAEDDAREISVIGRVVWYCPPPSWDFSSV